MDELLQKRLKVVSDILKGRKVLCKDMSGIKPLMQELNNITMDTELHIREYGAKLLMIVKKICGELEKEDGDETTHMILDAFNSLYSHVYHIMQHG